MKRLIITADDFGYSRNVNRAIIKCFKNGSITSTSLLVNTKYFDESVRLLKSNENLDFGMHINLTEFKPLTNAKTLTDRGGYFFNKNKWIEGHHKKAKKKEIEKEIEAQIVKALSSKLKTTHINGHNHIHVFPKVIDAVVKLAKKYKIKYIRLPLESNFRRVKQNNFTKLISQLSKTARNKINKNQLKATDDFYGILNMHDMDFDKLSNIVKSLKNGTSELMTHPAYIDRNGDVFHQSRQRENEINLLTNKKIIRAIKKLKINLTNFSEL